MSGAAARFAARLRDDPAARRQFGVTLFLGFMACGLVAYMAAALRFLPDLGIQMVAGGCVVMALAWLGPRVTLPLYFATWFGTAIHLGGVPVSLNRVFAAAFLVSAVAHLIRRRFRVPFALPVLMLAVLTLYAVGMGIAKKPAGAPASIQQIFYVAAGLLAASHFRTREDFARLAGAIVAVTCALSAFGLAEFVLRRDLFPQFSDNTLHAHSLRINGISRNAIQFAFNACWAMPWALFLFAESRTAARRRLALAALAFLAVLALLTFNRQTPFIVAGMMAVGLFFLRAKGRGRIAAFLVLCGLALAPFVATRLVARFQGDADHGSRDISLAGRVDKIGIASNMIRDEPWFGVGLDNFKFHWYERRTVGEQFRLHFDKGTPQYVDLGYLQIVTETGIVGACMFALLIASSFALWLRGRRRAQALPDTFVFNAHAALAMGFAQLLASMAIQDTFFMPHTYLLFGLLFAAAMIAKDEEQASSRAGQAPVAED